MKATLRRVIMMAVLAVPPAVVLYNVAAVHHASLVLSHYLRGKAGNCSLRESFEGESLSRLQAANADEIRASIKVIAQDGGFSLWRTPLGDYWMPKASGEDLVYDLAEQQRNIYGTQIRPGDIVLDAGANVGVFTRKALWAGAARVIAIEPSPENLECLRRNFASEIAAGRVILFPKGIWDKDDVLKFSVDPRSSASNSFIRSAENAQYIEVPVTTVDNLVSELKLPKVDFIKMDIEGAERKAITGARNTISRFHPRMALCTYHMAGDEIAVPQLVRDAYDGYRVSQTCLCTQDRITSEVAFFY